MVEACDGGHGQRIWPRKKLPSWTAFKFMVVIILVPGRCGVDSLIPTLEVRSMLCSSLILGFQASNGRQRNFPPLIYCSTLQGYLPQGCTCVYVCTCQAVC